MGNRVEEVREAFNSSRAPQDLNAHHVGVLLEEYDALVRLFDETAQRCDPAGETRERLQAQDLARSLLEQNQTLESKLGRIVALVNEQAEDEGLWFRAATAPEAYLQQELRKLHAAIEGTK